MVEYIENTAKFEFRGKSYEYRLHEMPEEYFRWQVGNRLKGLKIFLGEEKGMPNFSPHTVVMNTLEYENEFCINSCIKGLGLVPRSDKIQELGERAMELIRKSYEIGADKTFRERVGMLVELYSNPETFDRSVLSSMEMYKKRTYKNVLEDPRANLLFYDNQTGYSVMFSVVCEFVPRGGAYYNYVSAIHDLFHLPKDPSIKTDRYDFAYRFHLVEAFEKTPGPRASTRIY